jgi:dTDP-4-dehydrorhamnose reductase
VKIFIAGSKGQLGRDCRDVLGEKHDVTGLDLPEFDITSANSVAAVLGRARPDVVINCAAYTRVDAAETDRELARRVNVDGPRHLAMFTRRTGAFLVHISTDYVFAGDRPPPQPYSESDDPSPRCHYGATKLEGERAVQAVTGHYAILRTAWLYGIHGSNFLKTMLRLAIRAPGNPIRVVNDQFGSATWSWRLAHQIERLLEGGAKGLFHATAEGYASWYSVARRFLERMNVPHQIVPISTAEYPTPAQRPANSILENARLKERNLNLMRPWQEDVDEFADRYRERLLEEAEQAKRKNV